MVLFLFILGLIFGSFVSAVSYRLPRRISFVSGRSFCPHCRQKISWYDNIPLLSFILLKGKCRHCHKKISWRYPLIELGTGLGFLAIGFFEPELRFRFDLGTFTLPFFLFTFVLLAIIAVIDWEQQEIFDGPVFFLFFLFLVVSLFVSEPTFYLALFSGFSSALFLLFLNLLTSGKGMGLGDVKLALPLGFFLGFPLALVWLFLSFLTGALVGVILILMGKADFGRKISFGPFLILSFWLTLFWGEKILLATGLAALF